MREEFYAYQLELSTYITFTYRQATSVKLHVTCPTSVTALGLNFQLYNTKPRPCLQCTRGHIRLHQQTPNKIGHWDLGLKAWNSSIPTSSATLMLMQIARRVTTHEKIFRDIAGCTQRIHQATYFLPEVRFHPLFGAACRCRCIFLRACE